jgi:hypothetical protein
MDDLLVVRNANKKGEKEETGRNSVNFKTIISTQFPGTVLMQFQRPILGYCAHLYGGAIVNAKTPVETGLKYVLQQKCSD